MSQIIGFDIRDAILSNGAFGPNEITQISQIIGEDHSQFKVLKDSVNELSSREEHTPATVVRLGVGLFLLGHYERAAQTLANADGGALAYFYLGRSQFELELYDNAIASYQSAQTGGYRPDLCALAVAESQRRKGAVNDSLTTLDNLFGPVEQTAEYLYQRACTIASLSGDHDEVTALLERAVEADQSHAGALFGLALENDRQGNDQIALEYYTRAANRFPAHVGSLLNLGIMHEDNQDYGLAQQCYRRILEVYPDNERARLFLIDSQASSDEYYDEDIQKQRDRLTQVLAIPVTDFELSVRSRNCLEKMDIYTLGDLARCSEQELLSSKNFGETSLDEIRAMLTSKGLSLGQLAHEKAEPGPELELTEMSDDELAILDRPIADLNLSVRARKAMVRLGLNTIGELLRKTGDDMLECKNFGVTSLTEVREKLTPMGLKLRGD